MSFLKKIKIVSVHVKACNFIKTRLQRSCFPVNIPKVLGTTFFIEQLRWLFCSTFWYQKKNLKKRKLMERFALESLL